MEVGRSGTDDPQLDGNSDTTQMSGNVLVDA